ncbi:MAG: FAD/NAD(P)-binding oxidoreductase [Pseudomonadota bacterium]
MKDFYDVLIVGAGHGGTKLATTLVQQNFTGSIGLISADPNPPYERPPLSKDYFLGEKPFERLLFRPEAFWADSGVDLVSGRRVVSVNADAHRIGLDDGSAAGYGTLVWATGGDARRLTCPGSDLPGIHTVRTRTDIDTIKAALEAVEDVVVIGGGYIGLEAASALVKFGKRVTVLEAMDRVLARVTGETISRFFEAQHRAHGVDVRTNAMVTQLNGATQLEGVTLSDGTQMPAQMAIVGIGIIPAVDPLITAGAAGGNGVRVDGRCAASLPDVFAIGDCALHTNAFAGGAEVRLESVQNAHDQATLVARILAGDDAVYEAVPWFWSNQYDLRLQTAGISAGYDATVVRGDPDQKGFSVLYFKEDHLISIDAVNRPKDYMQGRKTVMQPFANPANLADPDVSLLA